MKQPLLEFLKTNFPEVIDTWNLSEDEWARMFAWYISTGNIFQFMRGVTMLGFVMYRPMTKEQLSKRNEEFSWHPEGEYLYVPLFVVKKEWKGRGMWNLVKGLAPYTYPNIKFVAYESWKDDDQELNIVKAPEKYEGRRKPDGKEIKSGTRNTANIKSKS